MTVLLTGASGFLGKAVFRALKLQGVAVRPVFRTLVSAQQARCSADEAVLMQTLDAHTDWTRVLEGVDAVVHAAARVHVMREAAVEPLADYRRVNVAGTLQLARQAAVSGVHRFVFISSIKVNGEATETTRLFCADDVPQPADAYGMSKMEAEQGLRDIAAQTGMEVVIIRPPLVYGPGVKANFESMMRWVTRGLPLPLGAVIGNRRSLVAVDNLVDLIIRCIDHPAAANQTFLVSDGEDLSTAELLRRLGSALGRPARLVAVPTPLLTLGATLIGKRGVAQRLCGSLQVDITKTKRLLQWEPPVSVEAGLKMTAEGFLRETAI